MTIFKSSSDRYKIGLIGFGAIGTVVADAIVEGRAGNSELIGVLRQRDVPVDVNYLLTHDEDTFFEQKYDLVIEAAGQQAVRQYAMRTFEIPADLLITSIGVLSDDNLQESLFNSATKNKVRFLLAGGALPAVDWMSAVAHDAGCKVTIIQEKPVASWRDTPAEDLIDLDAISGPQCFFEGSARETASQFPRSSNITAMLALSTVGLDACAVKLVADPVNERMRTLISFTSGLGDLDVEWHGFPSQSNPRSSIDVAHTVIKALRNLTSTVINGA